MSLASRNRQMPPPSQPRSLHTATFRNSLLEWYGKNKTRREAAAASNERTSDPKTPKFAELFA
jgi:hypothetical protein